MVSFGVHFRQLDFSHKSSCAYAVIVLVQSSRAMVEKKLMSINQKTISSQIHKLCRALLQVMNEITTLYFQAIISLIVRGRNYCQGFYLLS